MSDAFTDYRTGMNRLLTQLGRDHPRYTEALVLQQRLLENLARVRRYGDTDTSRVERVQVLDVLNHLALEMVGKSFMELFPQDSYVVTLRGSGAVAQGAGAVAAGTGGIAVGDDVEGDKVDTGGGAYIVEAHIVGAVGDGSIARIVVVEPHRQALEAARKVGDRAAEEVALGNLGSAYAAQGDFHRAVEHYERAIATARELGDRQTEAIYLQDLGLALLRLADTEPDQHQVHLSRAADAFQLATRVFDELEADPLLRARTRYHLGRCYHRLGRWREAITLLEQVRETFSRRKARPELAHALLKLGQLYHQRQDFESAYIYLKDALRLFRRLKDTDGIAVTQEALGSLALQTARPAEAITSLNEARRGYATLRRSERVQAVDDLLRMAGQSR